MDNRRQQGGNKSENEGKTAMAEREDADREKTHQEKGFKEEDARIEEALASTASLQSNFKPRGVTESQLAKLQELHKRRMQIKSKLKIHKKAKGPTDKFLSKNLAGGTFEATDSKIGAGEVNSLGTKASSNDEGFVAQLEKREVYSAPKKRQKLYWGLDAKERWERKSNM